MDKITGKIKWYKETKKHGYIIGSDEEIYYFDIMKTVNFEYVFSEGDVVNFVPHFESAIPYATEVEKI